MQPSSPRVRRRRCAAASGSISIPFFCRWFWLAASVPFCERYPELSIEFITKEHIGDLVSDGPSFASVTVK
jgi:hypothetical protein